MKQHLAHAVGVGAACRYELVLLVCAIRDAIRPSIRKPANEGAVRVLFAWKLMPFQFLCVVSQTSSKSGDCRSASRVSNQNKINCIPGILHIKFGDTWRCGVMKNAIARLQNSQSASIVDVLEILFHILPISRLVEGPLF